MKFELPTGILVVPVAQFTLNESQQFAVMGMDFDKYPNQMEFGETDEVKSEPIGKLEDQNFIFHSQIINSLIMDKWDFFKYPNPEIILLTDLKKTLP